MISWTIKSAVTFYGPDIGFTVKDVSARSICAEDAMDLICNGIDSKTIKLIGFWRGVKMLWYLHFQDEPIMRNLYSLMDIHGT